MTAKTVSIGTNKKQRMDNDDMPGYVSLQNDANIQSTRISDLYRITSAILCNNSIALPPAQKTVAQFCACIVISSNFFLFQYFCSQSTLLQIMQ